MEAQVEGNSLINYESVYINDYILYICYLKGVKKCLDTIYMLLTDLCMHSSFYAVYLQ